MFLAWLWRCTLCCRDIRQKLHRPNAPIQTSLGNPLQTSLSNVRITSVVRLSFLQISPYLENNSPYLRMHGRAIDLLRGLSVRPTGSRFVYPRPTINCTATLFPNTFYKSFSAISVQYVRYPSSLDRFIATKCHPCCGNSPAGDW
jgi:hypothetical protein